MPPFPSTSKENRKKGSFRLETKVTNLSVLLAKVTNSSRVYGAMIELSNVDLLMSQRVRR